MASSRAATRSRTAIAMSTSSRHGSSGSRRRTPSGVRMAEPVRKAPADRLAAVARVVPSATIAAAVPARTAPATDHLNGPSLTRVAGLFFGLSAKPFARARARPRRRMTFVAPTLYHLHDRQPQRHSQRKPLRRRSDQGAARPRRGPQAARNVHRRHRRRIGPPPHGVRGFGQCHRRIAGRPLRPHIDHPEPRRIGLGRGQWPRDPDRNSRRGRRVRGRGHHDPAPRRREVREHVRRQRL